MANVAYIRVSTAEQNEARQREALSQYPIDRWYIETASAKDADRPKLLEMLSYVREGDTIYIHDLSRLARSTFDLLALMELFEKNGIRLHSDKEALETGAADGKLMLTLLGAISQFERDMLLERQKERRKEGIAAAKTCEKYKGRRQIQIPDEILGPLYERYRRQQITKSQMCRELEISRPTLERLLAAYEVEHPEVIP